ncbi:hypothetical protein B0H14DRAFT_2580213 [Mycena olivaceomarginata]|nr:hypothetical protein B0H14DRAFT_2580213 [Mycena olivaceomarginata]
MSTDIALDRASLIALVLETFNNGIFTTLFAATLQLIFKNRINNSNRLMLPTLCLIWVLCMTHWIIDILRVMEAFLNDPAGALSYYEDVSNRLETAKTAVYVTVTLTGDFFMIYRCFIVWHRKWVVVTVPIVLWLGTAGFNWITDSPEVSGYGANHALLLAQKGGVFFQGLAPWITTFFSMSLALNVICTIQIIFLESAATYSTSLLVLLVFYVRNSNVQYIMLDVTTSLIGVTFSMILLRLSAQSQPEEDSLSSFRSRARTNQSYPLTSVAVSRLVELLFWARRNLKLGLSTQKTAAHSQDPKNAGQGLSLGD